MSILAIYAKWLPLLLVMISAALASLGFLAQRLLKRKDELIEKKRRVYLDYLLASTSVLSQQMYRPEDLGARQAVKERLMNARWELLLVANHNVAELASKNANQISRYLGIVSDIQQGFDAPLNLDECSREMEESFARLVRGMRSECLWRSDMNLEQFRQTLPFYTEATQ